METLKCILNTFKKVFFDASRFDSKFTPKIFKFTVLHICVGILLIMTFLWTVI